MTNHDKPDTNQPEQIPLNLGHREALEREDFLVSSCNELAVTWIDKWPRWSTSALILCGPPAAGKTHLASVWAVRSGAVIVPAQDLAKTTADEIAERGPQIVIDRLDTVIGHMEAEKELQHLYNHLREDDRSLLITMREASMRRNMVLADIRSRLLMSNLVEIKSPDDTLLAAVLIKHFNDRQLQISESVLQFTLARMERSFASAAQIAEAADERALAEGKKVTRPLMDSVLQNLAGSP